MNQILTIFLFLGISVSAMANSPMKLEGSCTGILKDGSSIKFVYYSDFDGCHEKINASVQVTHVTNVSTYSGKRAFNNQRDTYSFTEGVAEKSLASREIFGLNFVDSTGNTEGVLNYWDNENEEQSVVVQCEIRDYEYERCE